MIGKVIIILMRKKVNDRQSYNHPHEKKSGNQQESPVFSHIL